MSFQRPQDMNANQRAIWEHAEQILAGKSQPKGKSKKPEDKDISVKLVDEILVLGGRLHKTRQWVTDAKAKIITFKGNDGVEERYRLRGHNAKGVPIYQFMEDGDGGS